MLQSAHLHRYKYLWSKCQKEETIIAAWKKLRKGKTRRREVRAIEANFMEHVRRMQAMLSETRPNGNPELMFTPEYQKPKFIVEHGKEREIYRPNIWDQWVHHIVVYVLCPILVRHSYPYSCGSMPKRGGVYGKKVLERHIRSKYGFRYFAKLDIRHFFNSINIKFVIHRLAVLIADSWFLFLIERIFMWFKNKMPLGYYPSQWFANFVLSPLDWAIARTRPICYVRYVDDMVICSSNKRKLHKLIGYIAHLLGKIHLRLKGNYQVIKFDIQRSEGYRHKGRPIDYMGFVFQRKHTIIRKSILFRTTAFARHLHSLPVISCGQAQSMLSRSGWFKHTDTKYTWYVLIRPCISVKSLKNIVRKYQRRVDNENFLDYRTSHSEAGDLRAA